MRKLVLGIAGATALALASSANAAITLNTCTMSCTGPTTIGTETTIGYSDTGIASPTFTEWLNFTNTLGGIYSVSLSTSTGAVDFTSAYLTIDGINPVASLQFVGALGPNEFWGLGNTFLAAGSYYLVINGNNSRNGNLGGTVTIDEAVPEPATWAMMLLGFGAIGLTIRSRRRRLITQAA